MRPPDAVAVATLLLGHAPHVLQQELAFPAGSDRQRSQPMKRHEGEEPRLIHRVTGPEKHLCQLALKGAGLLTREEQRPEDVCYLSVAPPSEGGSPAPPSSDFGP